MGSWVQGVFNSLTSVGPTGGGMGAGAGAACLSTQPWPDRNGALRMNYACGGDGEACCENPIPSGEGSLGVLDPFLCLNWLPDVILI